MHHPGQTAFHTISHQEFPVRSEEYYLNACALGRLRVEGTDGVDQPLKTNHRIRHLVHRHEPPTLAQDPEALIA